jgi:hypothetical protein
LTVLAVEAVAVQDLPYERSMPITDSDENARRWRTEFVPSTR